MNESEPQIVVTTNDLRGWTTDKLVRKGFCEPELGVLVEDSVVATAEGHIAHGVGSLFILDELGMLTPGTGEVLVRGSAEDGLRIHAPTHLGALPCAVAVRSLLTVSSPRVRLATAVVSSRGHRGRIGHLARSLSQAGRLSLVCQSTEPCIRLDGRSRSALGTNPIAVGIPVEGEDSIVLDMGAAGVSFAQSYLNGEIIAETGLEVASDDRTRARLALAIAVQALAVVMAGHSEPDAGPWHTVLASLALPGGAPLPRETAADWRRDLGWHCLPGQRSLDARRHAEHVGVSIPLRVLDWLRA